MISCSWEETLRGLYQFRIVPSATGRTRREHEVCSEVSGMRLCFNGVSMARVTNEYGADPREL